MTRRDWWLGVAVLAIAIVLHAAFPRYEWRTLDSYVVRLDRWTGGAALSNWSSRQWVPILSTQQGRFTADDIDVEPAK